MSKLYLIGVGLFDQKDITLRGLEAVKSSDKVFLESYTSVLSSELSAMEELYGKPVTLLYRDDVEIGINEILKELAEAKGTYSFLVVGDPFGATTHSDLYLRACKLDIKVEAIHNASIMNAVGVCGMQLYSFGQTVSIPYFTEKWRPYSFINRLAFNYENGFHTLVLLDIRVKELTEEALLKGKKKYEPPRFMSVKEAIEQIIEAQESEQTKLGDARQLKAIGVARIGAADQKIVAGTLEQLSKIDFGNPLHSIVVCAPQLHLVEQEMFEHFALKN